MATALIEVPRGPVVFNQKSGNLDYEDKYSKNLRRWREAVREEALATQRANPEFDQAEMYIRLLTGDHWPKTRPRYRSAFYDNRMADARIERLALLTDIRPSIKYYSNHPSYKKQGEIVQGVITSEWQRLSLDRKLIAAVDHAQFSVGYWKIGAWMPGEMTVTPCGMDNVIPIQPAADIQESGGVLYRTYKNLSYFRKNWGDRAEGLERESSKSWWTNENNEYPRPGHLNEYTWNALSPQMRYALRGRSPARTYMKPMAFPVVELEEYWIDDPETNDSEVTVRVKDPNMDESYHNYWYDVRPGERLWPRKRLIVFAGDRDMSDGPNLYWHGFYPFAQLALDPVVWAPGGLSVYRNLVPLVKATNEIVAGTLDMIKKAVNPQIVNKLGTVAKPAWERFFPDLPGGRLQMNPNANLATDLRYIDPPQLPGYVFQMLAQYLLPTIDRRAGRLDTGRLLGKKQVPGSDTIENMREAMTAPFRLESGYVEDFLKQAGRIAGSNVFQFWTEKKILALLGPDGLTWEFFDFDPETLTPWSVPRETHWKNFSFEVARGSLHGASKDRESLKLFALRRMRDISRRRLLRGLEIGDIEEIEAELKQEITEGTALMPTGRTARMSRGQRTGRAF